MRRSAPISITPTCARCSSVAIARFQRTGRIECRPSAPRSSGINTMPCAQRVGRMADVHPTAVSNHLAASRAVAVQPMEELALSLTLQAAEAEDLATVEREAPGLLAAPESNVAQLQRRLVAQLLSLRREDGADVPTGHQVHGRPLVDLVDIVLGDGPAVAKDRHAVGERPDLVHPVRDHDDRRSIRRAARGRARRAAAPRHPRATTLPRRG